VKKSNGTPKGIPRQRIRKSPKPTPKAKAISPRDRRSKKTNYPHSKKTPERIAAILHDIESSTASTKAICAKNDISRSEWLLWLSKDEELSDRYARAKDKQLELMADEILDISDESSEDDIFIEEETKEGKSARRALNHEFVQRSKLRVDSRKWLLSKLKPKKYGDKLGVEHSGGVNVNVTLVDRYVEGKDG